MLVDSHCHLNFTDFAEDFPDIIRRAGESNVGIMQTICTKRSEFADLVKLTDDYHNIYCSIGIHPNNVAEEPLITADEIVNYTAHKKVIGIGETGLDFHYEHSPRDMQIESFREHIKAARITQLPIIIHTRNADQETVELLAEEMAKGSFPGLIHCFSTSRFMAEEALKLGLYISISGIVTFNKAKDLQDIIKDLPLAKLLVETDAPYLAPVPFRGKRNEPAFVKHTAQFLADLLSVSFDQLEAQTTKNFFNLFTKVPTS
jgi:TatD DNase family protein